MTWVAGAADSLAVTNTGSTPRLHADSRLTAAPGRSQRTEQWEISDPHHQTAAKEVRTVIRKASMF
jgi:hypothetical protein